MAEPNHPLPNLAALAAHLDPGPARDLVDALSDDESLSDVSEVLAGRLQARIAAIEEEMSATPEVA